MPVWLSTRHPAPNSPHVIPHLIQELPARHPALDAGTKYDNIMDIIEIIIGLLVVVVPLTFRLIGKSLEKSGNGTAGQFKKIAEVFDDGQEIYDPFESVVVREMPEDVRKPEETRPVVIEEAPRQIKAHKPIKPKKQTLVEDKPKKGEKIDPKKLVIYSEIMKPKY